MRKLILLCASLCVMVPLISASPAHAQNVLWVANNGSNANACSQTAPCATFQGAIDKGSVSQINCLTSGSYGGFTITASITIDCGTGNVGNVVVSTGTAITINAHSAATVVLRHLSLNGLGMSTGDGIFTQTFASGALIIEECQIHGFPSAFGIQFVPSSGRGLLQVSYFQVFDNKEGIVVQPQNSQIATVSLNRVELFENTSFGLQLVGTGVVAGTMRDSVVEGNGNAGIFAGAPQVFFTVEKSSIIANLGFGIETNTAGTIVQVGASTIGANATGVHAFAGSIISFGNNQMSANGTNGNFTSTTTLQ